MFLTKSLSFPSTRSGDYVRVEKYGHRGMVFSGILMSGPRAKKVVIPCESLDAYERFRREQLYVGGLDKLFYEKAPWE